MKQKDLVLIRYPDGQAITAIAFNEEGDLLGFANEAALAGIADLKELAA